MTQPKKKKTAEEILPQKQEKERICYDRIKNKTGKLL